MSVKKGEIGFGDGTVNQAKKTWTLGDEG